MTKLVHFVSLRLKINNSSMPVDEHNDIDAHFTADENHRYC